MNEGEAPAVQIGRLYEQHQRMVGALCRLLLRDPVEAEDAVQQTFLSAFGSLIAGTVPRQPAPWLAAIARRECWARAAHRRRRPLPLEEAGDPAASTDAFEDAIRSADVAALWSAINALPRTQRKAFLMREFSGLSYAEVAVALGVTESAIESLLVRARRQLRDGLATTASTANLALTPLVFFQQRLLRYLGGNPSARTGAASAVGLPVAVKLTATTAVIVAVGSVGASLDTTVFSSHRPARPSIPTAQHTAQQGAPGLLPKPTGGERDPAGSHRRGAVRTIAPAPHSRSETFARTLGIFRFAGSTAGRSTEPAEQADRSPSDNASSELPATVAVQDPTEATPSSSPPTDTTSTETTPTSTDTTSGDTVTTDATPADTPPTDTTSSDTTSSDSTSSDSTSSDTTSSDTTPTP